MPSHTLSERRKRGPSPAKAKKMLSHGSVHGKALTGPQKGLFGVIVGSARKRKKRKRVVSKT